MIRELIDFLNIFVHLIYGILRNPILTGGILFILGIAFVYKDITLFGFILIVLGIVMAVVPLYLNKDNLNRYLNS